MAAPTENTPRVVLPPASRRWWVVCLVGLYLGCAFALAVLNPDASYNYRQEEAAEIEKSIDNSAQLSESTNKFNVAAYVLIGALGAVGVMFGRPAEGRFRFAAIAPVAALLLLAFASVLWSDDRGITIRRSVAFGLMVLGSIGVTRLVTIRQLAGIFAVIGVVYALIGVYFEIEIGFFAPWSSYYRFCGGQHPNSQAMTSAMAVLGSFVLLSHQSRWRAALLTILLFSLTALVLTKSRTGAGATLVALLAVHGARLGYQGNTRWAPLAISGVGVLLLVVGLWGQSGVSSATSTATMGRGEHVASLTGRIPLWGLLLKMGAEQPVLGYGYGTFWTPERLDYVSYTVQWNVSHAHSIYINSFIELGFVGAVVTLWLIASAFWFSWRDYSLTRDAGRLFCLGLAVMASIHGLAETNFGTRGIPYFLLMAVIASLATAPLGESAPQAESASRRKGPQRFHAVSGGAV